MSGCKSAYKTIPPGSVSFAEKQRVYDFGKRQLESCITRQFIQITQREATENLAKLTLAEMQDMCDWLDHQNGKFIDMELVEIIDESHTSNSKVYRYKANFQRNEILNEIRIWVKTDGKFAGFIIREWKDEYPGGPYKRRQKFDKALNSENSGTSAQK